MTKSAIVWTVGKIFNKKNPWGILFYTFVPICKPKFLLFFENWQLAACQMVQRSDTYNSKKGHLQHPMTHLYTDTWWNKYPLTSLKCVKNWTLRFDGPWWLLKCIAAPSKIAHLVAPSSGHLRPSPNIQVPMHHYLDFFEFLKAPIFWKVLKWPWSCQNWQISKMAIIGPGICLKVSCVQIWEKNQKGSVPNCRLQIANRYSIRWFKCKLKPPKND